MWRVQSESYRGNGITMEVDYLGLSTMSSEGQPLSWSRLLVPIVLACRGSLLACILEASERCTTVISRMDCLSCFNEHR